MRTPPLHPGADRDVVKGWFENDIKTMSQFESGFLETNSEHFDGVLIDGGEVTSYAEFAFLKDRTSVFFLDDC